MTKDFFYETKVFYYEKMPQDVQQAFYECVYEHNPQLHNGCYFQWEIKGEPLFDADDENYDFKMQYQEMVDQWLIDNGAEDAPDDYTSGELLLISFSW